MDRNNGFSTCLGIIVSLVVLLVIGTLLNGWALATIWNWFIPSIFGLTSLSLWQAIGVSMVFELFTGTNRSAKDKSDTSGKSYTYVFIEGLVKVVAVPLTSVAIAWLVLQFAF